MSAIRKEIQGYIDIISDNKLEALAPLLSVLANESIVIETDLTDEEKEIIKSGRKEYKDDPNSFISLDDIN